jgi:hypothetical protein
VLFGMSFLYPGPASWRDYVSTWLATAGIPYPAVLPAPERMQTFKGALDLLGCSQQTTAWLTCAAAVATALVLICTWTMLARSKPALQRERPAICELCTSITIMAFLAFNPRAFWDDYTLLAVAFPLLWVWLNSACEPPTRWRARVLYTLMISFPLMSWVCAFASAALIHPRIQFGFVYLFLVLALAGAEALAAMTSPAQAGPRHL